MYYVTIVLAILTSFAHLNTFPQGFDVLQIIDFVPNNEPSNNPLAARFLFQALNLPLAYD